MNGCVRDPYKVPWGTRGPLQDRLGVPDSAVTEDRRERTLERLLGAQANRACRRSPRYRHFLACYEADGWPISACPV